MARQIRLALNADTTPLSISDTLVFKSCRERAREASESGFPAVNVDRSEPGLTPEKVKDILTRYELEVASGFFHGRFYDAEDQEKLLGEAGLQAEFSGAIGQTCLFVSAFVHPPERHAVAGSVRAGESVALSRQQFEQMARTLERIARLWQEAGIEMCFHPHVATYVEAPHEIEQLMELTDPSLVKLGPDTGHLFLGGGDPLEIIRRYFDRVGSIHIKDVKAEVVEEARREGLDYRQACGRGVWTEIGSGAIDFPSFFAFLRERDWSGWMIVETDHTGLPTALESSKASRRYLKEVIGI